MQFFFFERASCSKRQSSVPAHEALTLLPLLCTPGVNLRSHCDCFMRRNCLEGETWR